MVFLIYYLDGRLASTFTKNGTTAIQNPSYTYDANDQITKVTNGINANLTQTYGYDAHGWTVAGRAPPDHGWTRYLWMGDELMDVVRGDTFY